MLEKSFPSLAVSITMLQLFVPLRPAANPAHTRS